MSKKSDMCDLEIISPLPDKLLKTCRDHAGNIVQIFESGRKRVMLDFTGDPGLTEQAHKDQCDIVNLINSHLRFGGIPPMPESTFVDLTNMPSYSEALNTVLKIDDIFEQLPLKVRDAYGHDPVIFMDALHDPMQRDKLVELGIFNPMDGVDAGGAPPASNNTPDSGQA